MEDTILKGGGKTKFYMYFGIIKQINLILTYCMV